MSNGCPTIQRFAFLFVAGLFAGAAGCSGCGGDPEVQDADGAGETAAERDAEADGDTGGGDTASAGPSSVRIATFNASLSRDEQGKLVSDLTGGDDQQAKNVAEVLQRVRPDVVLINEFDRDDDGTAARIFADAYLAVGQGGAEPIDYPHRYVPKTNTGVHSGTDLNNDGQTVSEPGSRAYGNDAYGFGTFPGQYGMVIYSRFPIRKDQIRSFRTLRWRAMPENLLPTDFYSEKAQKVMRLSSKNHVDVPVAVGGEVVHVLASHPTPPSFDGPADRNGRRNHDEIRFWVDYLAGGDRASYIEDDAGNAGGLAEEAAFAVLGDLNADPRDGGSRQGALRDLLESSRITDPEPTSEGARQAAESDGGVNASHDGKAALDTADFEDENVGNLRVDYALPSANLSVEDSGVYWPVSDREQADLAGVSDHHLVWVEVGIGE